MTRSNVLCDRLCFLFLLVLTLLFSCSCFYLVVLVVLIVLVVLFVLLRVVLCGVVTNIPLLYPVRNLICHAFITRIGMAR